MNEYANCSKCIDYAEVRQSVLVRAFADEKKITGETSEQILDRYMTGVHERHLSGLSLGGPR